MSTHFDSIDRRFTTRVKLLRISLIFGIGLNLVLLSWMIRITFSDKEKAISVEKKDEMINQNN